MPDALDRAARTSDSDGGDTGSGRRLRSIAEAQEAGQDGGGGQDTGQVGDPGEPTGRPDRDGGGEQDTGQVGDPGEPLDPPGQEPAAGDSRESFGTDTSPDALDRAERTGRGIRDAGPTDAIDRAARVGRGATAADRPGRGDFLDRTQRRDEPIEERPGPAGFDAREPARAGPITLTEENINVEDFVAESPQFEPGDIRAEMGPEGMSVVADPDALFEEERGAVVAQTPGVDDIEDVVVEERNGEFSLGLTETAQRGLAEEELAERRSAAAAQLGVDVDDLRVRDRDGEATFELTETAQRERRAEQRAEAAASFGLEPDQVEYAERDLNVQERGADADFLMRQAHGEEIIRPTEEGREELFAEQMPAEEERDTWIGRELEDAAESISAGAEWAGDTTESLLGSPFGVGANITGEVGGTAPPEDPDPGARLAGGLVQESVELANIPRFALTGADLTGEAASAASEVREPVPGLFGAPSGTTVIDPGVAAEQSETGREAISTAVEATGESFAEAPFRTSGMFLGAVATPFVGGAAIGRGGRAIVGRARTRGRGEVPVEDITRQSVREGDEAFPQFSEQAVPGGSSPTQFPVQAADDPATEFSRMQLEAQGPFESTGLFHATREQGRGFTRGGFEAQASPRPYDPDAFFAAPELSPHFLRTPGGRSGISLGLPRTGIFSRPTAVRIDADVGRVPAGTRTLEQETRFLQQAPGDTAFVRSPELVTPEAEALFRGATDEVPGTQFQEVGSEFYTTFGGERVPIREVEPVSGQAGVPGQATAAEGLAPAEVSALSRRPTRQPDVEVFPSVSPAPTREAGDVPDAETTPVRDVSELDATAGVSRPESVSEPVESTSPFGPARASDPAPAPSRDPSVAPPSETTAPPSGAPPSSAPSVPPSSPTSAPPSSPPSLPPSGPSSPPGATPPTGPASGRPILPDPGRDPDDRREFEEEPADPETPLFWNPIATGTADVFSGEAWGGGAGSDEDLGPFGF